MKDRATRTLAIDYGTKRIGLAISHDFLAEPYKILLLNESIFTSLQEIISKEQIDLILVGLSENVMAEKTTEFVKQLKQHTSVPIEMVDESFSSATVHQRLVHSGMKRSRRQQPIDHFAAAEMLQEWLDTQYD